MKVKPILALVLLSCASVHMQAQDCDLHLMALQAPGSDVISEELSDHLLTQVATAIVSDGVYASADYTSFFISAKAKTLYKESLPGPPLSIVLKTQLTLNIGDIVGQKVYSTLSLELKGVGSNETRAYLNALQGLSSNEKVKNFVKVGKERIIDYYNSNYTRILERAKQNAQMRNYAEAIFLLSGVPECCEGYAQASSHLLKIYREYLNYNGQKLLQQARLAWANNPDEEGAKEVALFLTQIDPSSASYDDAMNLYKEVKEKRKSDWNFEMRKKYQDEVDAQKRLIEAARAVGVAFGNGQKPQTTNLMWMK